VLCVDSVVKQIEVGCSAACFPTSAQPCFERPARVEQLFIRAGSDRVACGLCEEQFCSWLCAVLLTVSGRLLIPASKALLA
jgi:hypothetical protein